MFTRQNFKFEFIIIFLLSFTVSVIAGSPRLRVQDDTVRTPNVTTIPTIDGQSSDACWGEVNWQEIDQVWIPYGDTTVEADDYTGQYKVVWSDSQNVLYFLVEVHDDVFVDGYVYPDGGYYNYDIVEVFIDEDKSGGRHVYDQGGENAENAFSYHIVVDAPDNGEVNSDFVVCDLAGFWETVNYASHFPDLAMRKDDNKYTWEFSLAVYDDTYDNGNPEASRVDLSEGKIIGLSLAYCDNDDPDGERDNFFGSVWVPAAEYNSHWENADGYGTVKLVPEGSGIEDNSVIPEISFGSYPNPFSDKATIEFNLSKSSNVTIDVLNVSGEVVATVVEERFPSGRNTVEWQPCGITSGIYFYRMRTDSFMKTRKFLLIR